MKREIHHTDMTERIEASVYQTRRHKKNAYYLACGSNVDGRLGISGTNEGCQARLVSLASFQYDKEARLDPYNHDHFITQTHESHHTHEHTKTDLENLPEALSISCGRAHTLCISKTDGSVYGWGSNDKGQLGSGNETEINNLFQPTKINVEKCLNPHHTQTKYNQQEWDKQPLITNENQEFIPSPWSLLKIPIATLACGYNHSLFITSSGGQIYSCGENKYGQLGLNDTTNRYIPTHVSTFHSNHFFVSAAGGSAHSLALTIKGEVFSFGRGVEGQLGDGMSGYGPTISKTNKNWGEESINHLHKRLIPGRVEGYLTDNPVIMIAASQGGHGSYAVTAYDGYGWRWGALDNENPNLRCDESYDDISNYALEQEKNIKTVPSPLPPPLGSYSFCQRDRAESAPAGSLSHEASPLAPEPEPTRRSKRSSSFDLTSEIVRNAATTATAKLATLSSFQESPPASPGSSQHLFPDVIPTPSHTEHASSTTGNIIESHRNINSSKDFIIAISAGAKHLVCVTRAGEAYSMGASGPHLGLGPACRFQWIQSACKMLLPGDVLINGVSCGEKHTLLSCTDGRIFVCGDGRYGMLGVDGKDLEMASCEENAVPKSIPLRINIDDKSNSTRSNIISSGNDANVVVSTTVSEFSLGHSTILHNLQKMHESKSASLGEHPHCESENLIEEDDEDYWGEEGLGHELEIDFNLVGGDSNPFGQSNIEEDSWKRRISRETKRRLRSGTKAVGGAIITTGGAVISGVVSAVTNGINSSNLNTTSDKRRDIRSQNSEVKSIQEKKKSRPFIMRSIENHQDSFDGLAGNARRRVMLCAGSSHSCVHIVDNIDD